MYPRLDKNKNVSFEYILEKKTYQTGNVQQFSQSCLASSPPNISGEVGAAVTRCPHGENSGVNMSVVLSGIM